MTRPLLPPRGIFTPLDIAYASQLPPAVILTWIRLHGLAWDGKVTPSVRLQDIAVLLDMNLSTLYNHLSNLKSRSVLTWQTDIEGFVRISFEKSPLRKRELKRISAIIEKTVIPDSLILEPGNLESENGPSLSLIKDPDPDLILDSAIKNKNIKTELNQVGEIQGERECEGERDTVRSQFSSQPGNPSIPGDAVAVYRRLTQRSPKPMLRDLIQAQVTDLPLWEQTLEHWMAHGWKPLNLAGMLNLYAHGGPSGCRVCGRETKPAREVKTAHQKTLEVLDSLGEEHP